MADEVKETEVTEEVQETEQEQVKEKDPADELRQQLEAERQRAEALETKSKDLSARLTREQQVRAEFERYHRETLPKINKKFEDIWEESPEKAVDSRVEDKFTPIQTELSRVKAEQAFTQVLVEHPEWKQYKDKVVDMGFEMPQWTYDKGGIEKLFRLAREEELDQELQKLKSAKETERQKEKAYTESSSPKEAPKTKVKLSSAQLKVANSLGISPEDYVKQMER